MPAGLVFGVLLVLAALTIVSLVRSQRIGTLERRIAGLEAAVLRLMREREGPPEAGPKSALSARSRSDDAPRPSVAALPRAAPGRAWEERIGQRWLAWVGILAVFLGAAFALKFAFENRWIGDLGRVLLGLASGVGLSFLGRWQLRLGRRAFSQTLTAGGSTLLYLSTYASYGFYQLIDPSAAFTLLVIIVVYAHLLGASQNAPGIALLGQIGGFLTPLLLDTGQDRHWILFSYILLLDAGVILAVLLRRWRWISSVSFAFTYLLFFAWREDHYQPEKLWVAVAFLTAVFALFAFADLAPHWRGRPLALENWIRVFLNPLAFFGVAYALLEPQHPQWMGLFALTMAIAYAALARLVQGRRTRYALSGLAGLFVTLAIPIQLEAHWVTLAWGLQGCILAWLAARTSSIWFGRAATGVFACALVHYLGSDAPWRTREAFTPLLNRDFASAAALAACLLYATFLLRRALDRLALTLGLCAAGVLWLASTIEAYSYFDVLMQATSAADSGDRNTLRWTGQTTVSVLWALYSSALVAGGLRHQVAALRWGGLALFGLTVLKVSLFDIASLEGGYRAIALLVLGVLLLAAAWAYQRMSR